ncbi:hypothetical protein AVEN_132662-1 [Araneus ventricosus]|uniref:Uncharacterized protein n=1 Tax=Araneus ventricosus TaxID=182803 RepID=A0A4Y2AW63_ARAVE|nr:hypothetical protein AVEN_132662-1 [Araneus ventricosus]
MFSKNSARNAKRVQPAFSHQHAETDKYEEKYCQSLWHKPIRNAILTGYHHHNPAQQLGTDTQFFCDDYLASKQVITTKRFDFGPNVKVAQIQSSITHAPARSEY